MTLGYLRSRFIYCDNVSAYRLRNAEKRMRFVLPQPRTESKRCSVRTARQLWNNLPIDLRQASSLTDFKSKLSRYSLYLLLIEFEGRTVSRGPLN